MPNIADEDKQKWKAKLVGHTTAYPQVEIRKTLNNGVSLTLIVSLGNGYKYKSYQPLNVRNPAYYGGSCTTEGNVHMALNGGGQLTFAEMTELQDAVQEAREVLENLPR